MSKDSSATYLHLHSSHHADLFEDFCRPPSTIPVATSSANSSSKNVASQSQSTSNGDPTSTTLPGHYLPFDDIYLPDHLQPMNPEDEDDVVPQGHAAWGIVRAMQLHTQMNPGGGRGGQGGGELQGPAVMERWRDLGMDALARDGGRKGNGSERKMGAREGMRRKAILLR